MGLLTLQELPLVPKAAAALPAPRAHLTGFVSGDGCSCAFATCEDGDSGCMPPKMGATE